MRIVTLCTAMLAVAITVTGCERSPPRRDDPPRRDPSPLVEPTVPAPITPLRPPNNGGSRFPRMQNTEE